MDFPTCPECGQSVLDDDAQDCPFCGASMSGAPAKKATPKPAKKTASKPSGKADAKKPAAKSVPEKAKPSGDDPFDMDTTAAQRAIPLQRKPSKGRMHRVACPMCETNGFTSKKAAGKDVRCANPECLVPIFTAPKLDEPESEAAESEKAAPAPTPGSSSGMTIGIAVAAVAVVGGAIWFFGFRSDSDDPKDQIAGNQNLDPVPDPGALETPADDPNEVKKDETAATDAGPSLAELRTRSLERMIAAARQRDNNRSKPLCRRLTAEAYALLGDFTQAANQRQQLSKVGQSLPHYHVLPFCVQAWSQLQKGDSKAAAESAEAAWQAGQKLPTFGQTAAEATVNLAAILVAVGRDADANDLIKRQNDSGPFGQFAVLLTDAYNRRSFDIDEALMIRPVVDWSSPQRAAAIQVLVVRGQADKALSWAGTATDVEAKTEAYASWAAASARAGNGEAASAAVESHTAQLPAASKARILAQLALGQAVAGDKADAEKSVAAALAAASSVKKPAALPIPDMKLMYEYELPDASTLQAGILAFAEIARVQGLLGKTAEAGESLALACDMARGISPGPAATQACVDETAQVGATTIKNRLQGALGINTTDQLNIALRRYRTQCQKVNDAAQSRFNLQVAVLTRAVDWGLLDAVWSQIEARTGEAIAEGDKEPYFDTALPAILADAFATAGNGERAQSIQDIFKTHSVRASAKKDRDARTLQHKREQSTWKVANGGDPRKAAIGVNTAPVGNNSEKAWKWEWAMRLACRLVNADRSNDAFVFTAALNDPVQREDVYRLTAALATKRGDGAPVMDFITKSKLPFTEQVAALSGVVTGATAAIVAESGE